MSLSNLVHQRPRGKGVTILHRAPFVYSVKHWDREHKAASDMLRFALQDLFTEQAIHIARLIKRGHGLLPELLFQPDAWQDKLQDLLHDCLLRIVITGAESELELAASHKKGILSGLASMAKLPGIVGDAIQRYISEALSRNWWQTINGTVQSVLSAILGRAKPDKLAETATEVQSALIEEGRKRADTIARSETTGALNAGHHAARQHLKAQGMLKGMQWVAVMDEATRETHAEADGQIIGPDELFEVGGEQCRFPGDSMLSPEERCNCRCTSVSILE